MIALVFAVLLCPLRLVSTNGAVQKSVSSVTKNNSANSVSRLFSINPVGFYASASPYGAYSFYAPKYVPGPQTASSKIVPVKEENVFVRNSNGYLKDSYGNRFVESPQSVAYKTILPQQFVQLQDLPAHLSQPLTAAAPSYNLKQQSPQYYYASPHLTALSTIPSVSHFMRNPQSFVYGANFKSLTPSATYNSQSYNTQRHGNSQHSQGPHSAAAASSAPQHKSSNYKAAYADTQNVGHKPETKYQRLQENPHSNQIPKSFSPIKNKELIRKSPSIQSITTTVNGKKTVINLDTQPPLHLLDLSLLEPLTFANPVVPQLQHFLPRIPTATYHELPTFDVQAKKHDDEFIVTNTRSYDSGNIPESSDEDALENNDKSPSTESDEPEQDHGNNEEYLKSGDHDNSALNDNRNKSPNYKEINNEKVISYTKTTQSEPKTFSYSKNTSDEPVHYSYNEQAKHQPIQYSKVYSSSKPNYKKEIDYDNENQIPKQLISQFKNNELPTRKNAPQSLPSDSAEAEHSGESEEGEPIKPTVQTHYNEQPRHFINSKHLRPEHRQELRQGPVNQKEQFPPIQYLKLEPVRPPIRIQVQHLTPPEYEQNIQLWPLVQKKSAIKVNPNQHIAHKAPAPSPQPKAHTSHHLNIGQNKQPIPQFHSTAKHVIIKDESPDEKHVHQEQMMKEEMNHEENSEEDFEKSYKNAAYGFPAFDKNSEEENAFEHENYGVPRYNADYNIEDIPFQRYQTQDDDYPKSMQASYKDTNEKNKENYYLDFSINKPESLVDEYQNKINYYKMLRNHKKNNYFPNDDDNEKKKHSKYVSAPSYGFESDNLQKSKKHEEYRSIAPQFYEYDFSKEAPRDNSADTTHTNFHRKGKTQFVEPQFQYGFEPLSLPSLLNSELSAVASNDNPKSETPELRKKIYKENFYIKKTNISGGKPAS